MWNDKPDGYPIPAWNPTGMGINFYPRVRVQVQISTRSLFAGGRVIALLDPLSSLLVGGYVVLLLKCSMRSSEWKLKSGLPDGQWWHLDVVFSLETSSWKPLFMPACLSLVNRCHGIWLLLYFRSSHGSSVPPPSCWSSPWCARRLGVCVLVMFSCCGLLSF
jgi:hypothetical protein